MSAIRNVVLGIFVVVCFLVGALAGDQASAAAKKDPPVTAEQVIHLAKKACQLEHQAKQADAKAEKAKSSLDEAQKIEKEAGENAKAKRNEAKAAQEGFLEARKELEKKKLSDAAFKVEEDKLVAKVEEAAKVASDAEAKAAEAAKKLAAAKAEADKQTGVATDLNKNLYDANQRFRNAVAALVAPKPIEASIAVRSEPQGHQDSSGVYYAPDGAGVTVEVGNLEPEDLVTVFVDNRQQGQALKSAGKDVKVVLGTCTVGQYSLSAQVRRGEKLSGSAPAQLRVIKRPPQPRITAVVERDQRLAGVGDIYHVLGWEFDLEVQVAEASPGDKVEACLDDDAKSLGKGAELHPNLAARVPVNLSHGGTLTLRARVIRFGIAGPPSGLITVVVPLVGPPAAVPPKKVRSGGPKAPAGPTTCSDARAKTPPLGDAFEHLPVVRVVPAKDEADGGARLPSLEDSGYTFADPAHFPLPQYCRSGCCRIDDIGLVIYQGMRFVTYADGRYRVRFVVSAPAMPVVLRLQLYVFNSSERCDVTLPPIRMPEKKSQSVGEAEYLVEHEGYLPKTLSAEPTHVVRKGTARFGHGRID